MDKLLIIGGSGLIGQKAMELGKSKYEVFGTYNSHKPSDESIFKLDVTKKDETFEIVKRLKPDFIIDTHTLPNIDYCEQHPDEAWEVNVVGTRNIAEAAKAIGAKFVHISTDIVFDGSKTDCTEDDKPNPVNYYAKTKVIEEAVTLSTDQNSIIVRTSVVYGKGGIGKVPFAVWLIGKLRNNETVMSVTDQYNNPTLADQVVEAILKLFEKNGSGIFHVTGKDCLNRYEFSMCVAKIFALNDKLITPATSAEFKQVAKRPFKLQMNTDKIERVTGMRMLHAEEGLKILKSQLDKEQG